MWPSPTRQGELRGLADRVRHAGVLTGVDVPERLDAADTGWLGEQRLVLQRPGCLVAAADRTSRLSHPVRRQLACVGVLSATELLRGLLRARPGYQDVDAAAIGVWAMAQHDLTALPDGHFAMRPGTRTWQLRSDPLILELVGAGQTASRRDILARLVADGLTPASASLWLVRCPWLRPADQRAVFWRAGPPATSPAPGRPPSRQRRPRGMSAR